MRFMVILLRGVMVFGDLELETTSERGSSTALMNRWRMAGLLWWRPGMATGPTLVSEKLDQAAEIPRERRWRHTFESGI
jgi:hypothetical protein